MNRPTNSPMVAEQFATTKDIAALAECLADLKGQIIVLTEKIGEMTARRDFLLGRIKLDRKSLQDLLGVSKNTIYKWRKGEDGYKLIAHSEEDGSKYYLFSEVFQAIRQGKLHARGFKRLWALQRMVAYQEGCSNGYSAASEFVFDDSDSDFINKIESYGREG